MPTRFEELSQILCNYFESYADIARINGRPSEANLARRTKSAIESVAELSGNEETAPPRKDPAGLLKKLCDANLKSYKEMTEDELNEERDRIAEVASQAVSAIDGIEDELERRFDSYVEEDDDEEDEGDCDPEDFSPVMVGKQKEQSLLERILGRVLLDGTAKEIWTLEAEIAVLKKDNGKLEHDLKKVEEQLKQAKADNTPLRRKTASIEGYGQNLRDTLHRYQSEGVTQRLEIEKLRADCIRFEKRASEYRTERDAAVERRAELAKELDEVRERLVKVGFSFGPLPGDNYFHEQEDAEEVNRKLAESAVEENGDYD